MRSRIFLGRYIQCIVLLLCLALIGHIVAAPTLAYVMTQTPSFINTFISGLSPEGGLIICKTVEHPFGEAYQVPDDLQFNFRVELGEEYADKAVVTSQGDLMADSNGELLVTLGAGESVMLSEILAGTNVTVTELQQSPGFAVSDGSVSKSALIVAKTNATIHFVNTYVPAAVSDVNLSLTGIKNLEGRPWIEGDTFTFRLEYRCLAEDNSQWTDLGTASVTYDPAVENFNLFDMTELIRSVEYSHWGIYAFRLSETEGSIGGVTYDPLISYFDVLVHDADMDGFLELQQVTGTSGATVTYDSVTNQYAVAVEFNNTYAPFGSSAVDIPIFKTLHDLSGLNRTAEGFTFELYTPDGMLLQTSEPTNAAGETSLRLVYEASQAGQSFTYILKETGSGTTVDGMQYSQTEYTVHVNVIDNMDGTVTALLNATDMLFENIYDPQDAQMQLGGNKVLNGRPLRDGEFAFDLYQTDASFMIADGVLPLLSTVNALDGTFFFEPLIYDQVGTFHYVVLEDAIAALGGIIYDDTVYHVTVSVTDENGILTATSQITNISGETAELNFVNRYAPLPYVTRLCGKKLFEGGTLSEGMFDFKIYEADNVFAPQGQAIGSVKNDAEGNFTFPDLSFETSGVYYYVVREEVIKRLENVIYDDTVYGIMVTVTDDGNGALAAQTVITCIGGETTNEIVFENVYVPQLPPDGPDEPDKPDQPDKPGKPDEPAGTNDSTGAPFIIMIALCVLLLIMVLVFDLKGCRYWIRR